MSLIVIAVIGILTSWMASKLVEVYVLGHFGGMLAGIIGAFTGTGAGKLVFKFFGESTYGKADLVGSAAVGAIGLIIFSGWYYRYLHAQKTYEQWNG